MFLKVRKGTHTYLQHKDMEGNRIAPVTSNFRINLAHVAEVSSYSLKEDKIKLNLENNEVLIPHGARVIHMEMSYTHSTHTAHKNLPTEHTVNERYFYRLFFLPGADEEFVRINQIIERHTVS